jgi:hypothetical protein
MYLHTFHPLKQNSSGKMAAAYLFGFLVTWLAPKNKPVQ